MSHNWNIWKVFKPSHEISNHFFKNHWKGKFKMQEAEKEGEVGWKKCYKVEGNLHEKPFLKLMGHILRALNIFFSLKHITENQHNQASWFLTLQSFEGMLTE